MGIRHFNSPSIFRTCTFWAPIWELSPSLLSSQGSAISRISYPRWMNRLCLHWDTGSIGSWLWRGFWSSSWSWSYSWRVGCRDIWRNPCLRVWRWALWLIKASLLKFQEILSRSYGLCSESIWCLYLSFESATKIFFGTSQAALLIISHPIRRFILLEFMKKTRSYQMIPTAFYFFFFPLVFADSLTQ